MRRRTKKHIALLSLVMSLAVTLMALSGCGKKDAATTPTETTAGTEAVSASAEDMTESEAMSTAAEDTAESEAASTAARDTTESEAASTTAGDAADSEAAAKTTEDAAKSEAADTTDAGESSEAAPAKRQVGDRYEDVIVYEGYEEILKFEHVKNEAAGFEMDYEYSRFVRKSDSNGDIFTLNLDGVEEPQYYLEVSYSSEEAEAAAASISEELSKNYSVTLSELTEGGKMINAVPTEENQELDELQSAYVIPAADGCRVARAHYSYDSSDFFGNLFSMMMDSISAIDRQG